MDTNCKNKVQKPLSNTHFRYTSNFLFKYASQIRISDALPASC